jgi:hypothetical protein
MIIGFTGPAGAGKSTAARILADHGWWRLSFADPLRRMARRIHPEWPADVFDHGRKDHVIPELGYSPRYLLRTIGDEINRLCPGAFVQAMDRDLERLTETPVVIDDVRYEAEAALVRERGGVVVHVQRSGVEYRRDHSSEEPLSFVSGDLAIDNRGDMTDLAEQVSAMLGRITARHER